MEGRGKGGARNRYASKVENGGHFQINSIKQS